MLTSLLLGIHQDTHLLTKTVKDPKVYITILGNPIADLVAQEIGAVPHRNETVRVLPGRERPAPLPSTFWPGQMTRPPWMRVVAMSDLCARP